jgi:hypothetical protein
MRNRTSSRPWLDRKVGSGADQFSHMQRARVHAVEYPLERNVDVHKSQD